MSKVTRGERPPRPTYPTFTERLWELTQRCWDHNHKLCPGISEVLRVLPTTSAPHLLTCSNLPAWKRLTSSHLSLDEQLALISSIFADRGEVEAVVQLPADDARAFVNATDEINPPRGPVFESWDRILVLILYILSIRRWMASQLRSEGGACIIYPEFAAAKAYFQNCSQIRFATALQRRCSIVGRLQPWLRGDIMAGWLQQRFGVAQRVIWIRLEE